MEWQQIESAPEGTSVLISVFDDRYTAEKNYCVVAARTGEEWWPMDPAPFEAIRYSLHATGAKATHWMPLPEGPSK